MSYDTARARGIVTGNGDHGNKIVGDIIINGNYEVYGQTTREGDDWRARSNKRQKKTRLTKVDTHKCIL